MSNDRRLSAPGGLTADYDIAGTVGTTVATGGLPGQPLAELAAAHGLRPSAQRPPLLGYVVELWRRRHFIMAFATARNIAMYTQARLGQVWQVLTPLLNAGVYFLIFGVLLKSVSRGIPNYPAFLVTGVFVFNFTQRSFISSSTVMTESLPLIRALQFPRASLPIAAVMIELQQLLVSMAVLAVIVLATGEPITWYWLLAIPALLLQMVFNIGVGLFVARVGSQLNDFTQLLPFLMRTWMYLSGVLFSIQSLASRLPHAAVVLLQVNPPALYITLMRNALLVTERLSARGSKPYNKALCAQYPGTPGHQHLYDAAYCHYIVNPSHFWLYAAGWAVVSLVGGYIFFWWAETKYGRG